MNVHNMKMSGMAMLLATAMITGCGGNAATSSGTANIEQGGVESGSATQMVAAQEQSGDTEPAVHAIRPVAVLEAENDSFDFGVVEEGVKVEHVFEVVNTGEAPLIINNVLASCGCTTPEYSKHPIIPGETGEVKVVFDSNGQPGKQHKIITVMSNAENRNVLLHLRGEVKTKI